MPLYLLQVSVSPSRRDFSSPLSLHSLRFAPLFISMVVTRPPRCLQLESLLGYHEGIQESSVSLLAPDDPLPNFPFVW